MLLQIFLFLFLGIFAGTITGLTPGIHINLVGALVVSLTTSVIFFSLTNPIYLVIFITAMAITHTFVDFIPSIFLGCPNDDTALTVLPGHELLLEGKGFQAIKLASLGALTGIIILILSSFPLFLIISSLYNKIKFFIPWILILVSISLIFGEEKKFLAFFVFMLSGILGWSVLNFQTLKEPLLPLLTGLFGASTILISIKSKTKIPEQKPNEKLIYKGNFLKNSFAAFIFSPLAIFLPALGSGQIALIGNSIARQDKKGFLFLQGAVNSLAMGYSFLALSTISKTRTGSAAAIEQLIGIPSSKIFILILITALISGIASYFLSLKLGKIFLKIINHFNYSKISIFILILLIIITFIFSGIFGLMVLTASASMGIYGILSGVRRTNLMGCLLVPTILYYIL